MSFMNHKHHSTRYKHINTPAPVIGYRWFENLSLQDIGPKRSREDNESENESEEEKKRKHLDSLNLNLESFDDPEKILRIWGKVYREFFDYACKGDIGNVLRYLAQHISVNMRQDYGNGDTVLICAVKHNHFSLVRRLIQRQKGIDSNMTNRLGWTPLMYAAHNGNQDIVSYLLSCKVNVTLCNHHGQTAEDLARQAGHFDIAQLLKEATTLNKSVLALEKEPSDLYRECFDYACKGDIDRVHIYLGQNIPVNMRQDYGDGDTVLICAIKHKHFDLVMRLTQRGEGIDLNRTNRLGWTPLMYAAHDGQREIVSYLLSCKVNVALRNPKGQTAHDLAMQAGHLDIARLLNKEGLKKKGPSVKRQRKSSAKTKRTMVKKKSSKRNMETSEQEHAFVQFLKFCKYYGDSTKIGQTKNAETSIRSIRNSLNHPEWTAVDLAKYLYNLDNEEKQHIKEQYSVKNTYFKTTINKLINWYDQIKKGETST